MADVAALEAEVKEFKLQVCRLPCDGSISDFFLPSQLETVQSSLQVDPDNTELQSLKTELEELINLTETSIAELKPLAPPAAAAKASPPPVKEKWSKENHPAYQSGYRKPTVDTPEEAPAPVTFSVNDHVLARWVSGDNSFYPARITSITGSSSNPVYIVSFKSYGTVETLTAKDIKPISNGDSRKRKADGSSGYSSSQTPTPQPLHSSVISAAADINPALANQARKEPSKAGDESARPAKVARKVKANKELEAGKMKWKDFASKSKLGRKESMFRTGEGVNARGKAPLV
jgi:survival-of-motor-neuron-related-splicing factor 30